MNDKKKVLLSVLGIFILLIVVFGVSFAFFSYLSTGDENTIQLGEIEFTASTETMQLTNVFPTTKEEATEVATVSVQGYTTYKNGIDFTIKAVEVVPQNTNIIPTVVVERETVDGITYTDGGSATTTYDKNNRLTSDMVLCRGHVEGNKAVGTTDDLVKLITISVYYDKAEYHISDNTKKELTDAGLLPNDYAGEVITTPDWNALNKDSEGNEVIAYSFKIQVTAVEGEGETTVLSAVETIKSKVGTDGLVAVNTSGALARDGDTIREYRYSGSAKYCTYTITSEEASGEEASPEEVELQQVTYNIAVEGDTCPNACDAGAELYTFKETTTSCSTTISPNQTTPIDGEVDNYILFNNEMWRIIGVFTETKSDGTEEELVKIVREVPLTNAEVPTTYTYNGTEMTMKNTSGDYASYQYAYMYWNYSKYFSQTNLNDWTKATTQYYLNDETTGASSYYNSINPIYQSMIETVRYDISNVYLSLTASEIYRAERRGDVHTDNVATWTGKIGMIYPSDYAYAAESGAWSVASNYYSSKTQPATLSNWMNDNKRGYEWTMSPSSIQGNGAVYVRYYGYMNDDSVQDHYAVSPVLYLKSSAMITGGDGSEGNPYTLG